LVPYTVAAALGVQDQTGRPLTDLLISYLRAKELLLVLDNCEHLLEAAAQLSDQVLRGCPQVRILVTSREPLNLAGEVTWRVPTMALPDLRLPVNAERLRESDAVELFVDRARLAQPAFQVDQKNAMAIANVCLRLDGIPLAIELAATLVKVLTVEQILERLEQRFRLLTGGTRTVMPRHRTLRAAFDWSYELLSEPERRLFRRLSVFSGTFGLDSAEAVCSEPSDSSFLDVFGHLVDKSMVMADPATPSAARYRLLETLREYSREKLQDTGELDTFRRRHVEYFVALAESAQRELRGPKQGVRLAQLDGEHDNFRAALAWCRGSAPELGLLLAVSLTRFWQMRGFWGEGLGWLEGALAEPVSDRHLLARGRLSAGTLAVEHGDYVAATRVLEESLLTFRELRDLVGVASALIELGRVAYFRGDMQLADSRLEEALVAGHSCGDRWAVARSLIERGQVAWRRTEYVRARDLENEGLSIFRDLGDRYDILYAVDFLGHAAHGLKDFALARQHFEESLAIAAEVNDLWGIAHARSNLGDVAFDQHQLAAAESNYVAASELHQQLGRPAGLLTCIEGFAGLAAARAQHERAIILEGACARLRETSGVWWRHDMRARVDGWLPAARAKLSPAAAARAESRGSSMTADDALRFSFEEVGTASGGGRQTVKAAPSPVLTRREADVATLVARGLTSKQIAARLFISERTAETHVDRILTKLDFHSRAQIAVWAVQQGLIETAGATT
jgi:non-specific serine/threonine protein kinase